MYHEDLFVFCIYKAVAVVKRSGLCPNSCRMIFSLSRGKLPINVNNALIGGNRSPTLHIVSGRGRDLVLSKSSFTTIRQLLKRAFEWIWQFLVHIVVRERFAVNKTWPVREDSIDQQRARLLLFRWPHLG